MEWVSYIIGTLLGAWVGTKIGIWLADGGLRRLLKGKSYTDFLK